MNNQVSTFLSTPYVIHGVGALSELPKEIERLKGTKVGVLTDKGLVEAGIREKVEKAANRQLSWYEEIEPEPTTISVDNTARFLAEHNCDVVIAVGGGSAIDTAKMAAVIARHGGKVTDYYEKTRDFSPGAPLIAVPTTAGTGSEATPAAVFKNPTDSVKRGIRSDFFMPASAILDPEITVSLPQKLTASTGMDALTHALEAYVSPIATVFSDMVAERAITLIFEHLKAAIDDGKNLTARSGMLIGSYLGGVAISIANVGAVHGLAHTLGGMHGVPHGLANAMILPHVMEFNSSTCAERYANVARLLDSGAGSLSTPDAAKRARDLVVRLAKDVGIPSSFREIGVPESAIQEVPDLCLESQARILAFNPRPMAKDEAIRVLTAAYSGSD